MLNESVSVLDLKKMDLKDLYVQSVVMIVKRQNEIVALNNQKVKR